MKEDARPFGRYENVFLTETEVGELQSEYPGLWQEYIERLSSYMASTGKTYASHAATLRRWLSSDRKQSGRMAYIQNEEESL